MRLIMATLAVLALACAGGSSDEAATVAEPAAAPGLDGSWSFFESCGENAGGVGVGVGYSLSISGKQATLTADGYQTMLRAAATVEEGSDGVHKLVFSHLTEEGSGAYLSPGDVMITFTAEDGDLMVTPVELIFACTETTLFSKD